MSQENVEVIRSGIEAFNREDIGALAAVSADDLEIHPATETALLGEEQAPYRGTEAWSTYFAVMRETWQVWRIEDAEVFDAGDDRVAAVFRITGTGRESGAPVEHQVGIVYTLRGGKVRRLDGYLDPRRALEAVGLRE
jgi:ketosteroid isomerase-like protein